MKEIIPEIGDVISYLEMCSLEGVSLQRGMNYRLVDEYSVILMSLRKGAPYQDRVEDEGRVLIYEGHDSPRRERGEDPKSKDQPLTTPKGSLTQNGLFYSAAKDFKEGKRIYERVRVYEKIRQGIWVYNGFFRLVDAWQEENQGRRVFKFRLEIDESNEDVARTKRAQPSPRLIPTSVKLEVWKRDKGRCVMCGREDNLHFDHIIPHSRGGSSLTADNIQILCFQCNLEKSDKIG